MWTNSLPPELLNTVHCMDCLEFMRTLPDGCVDLVLTDPPYGIWMDRDINNKSIVSSWNNRDNNRPEKIFFDEMQRVSKNQIIRWGNYFADFLPPKQCWLVRDKNNWSSTFADWELARTSFDTSVRIRKIHWTWLQCWYTEDTGRKEHPTQKPRALFRRILEDYSEQWMTILDCFAWSWTTWVACKELWRNYILVEKEPKYVDIIHKRLQNTTVSLFHS